MPNQAGPSQETNTGPISSSTSLQPNQSLKVVLCQPRRTLPPGTIVDTASKLGHNILTNDPSPDPKPTQPTRPHGDIRTLTGTLGPGDRSLTNTDVRTFVSHWVCPDIGSHTVHPASAWWPEPRLFRGRDGGLWEWSDLSCHSLVGSFKIEFFFFSTCAVCIACFLWWWDKLAVCITWFLWWWDKLKASGYHAT
jgi:hypothetical protein